MDLLKSDANIQSCFQLVKEKSGFDAIIIHMIKFIDVQRYHMEYSR